MLTKDKRNKLIAGIMVAVMAVTVGCGKDKDKQQEEENEQTHTTTYIPMSGGSSSSTGTTANVVKTSKPSAAPAAKVTPSAGKTGISNGGARSSVSAVS